MEVDGSRILIIGLRLVVSNARSGVSTTLGRATVATPQRQFSTILDHLHRRIRVRVPDPTMPGRPHDVPSPTPRSAHTATLCGVDADYEPHGENRNDRRPFIILSHPLTPIMNRLGPDKIRTTQRSGSGSSPPITTGERPRWRCAVERERHSGRRYGLHDSR
jgi:hypothetical protein